MQLTMTADETALSRLVGTETFLRGRDYARRGAVLNPQSLEDPQHIFGQVRGAARMPYTAIAVVSKSADGKLASFQGTCTCPVRVDCKHTVALVLASLPHDAGGADGNVAAPHAPWERALIDLARDDDQELPPPAVALQLELIAPSMRPPYNARPVPPRLGLRPVLPGKNGGWVRAGIAWSSVGYLSYSRRDIAPEYLRLLTEIMAMDSSGPSAYYGGASHAIYLESLASRRIWDLLAEARDIGMPLVHAGKQAPPVAVYDDDADLVLDLSRSATGLVLRSQVIVGRERPALDAALLLGDPVHGIAWWQADGELEPRPNSGLRLARFSAPVDSALRHLVEQRTLLVPRRDEIRFFSEYYAVLRQRARVTSGDESVTLPEPLPPALTLIVRHLAGHRLSLEWQWRYSLADVVRREPLWPPHGPARGRDLEQEGIVLSAVLRIAGSMPELCEVTTGGARLAPAVELDGFATIRFTTDVLPGLAELSELTIETHGTPTSYREAVAAPVVAISGSESPDDRDWFDLAVTVSVDGEQVPFERLFVALSAGESHLILPSGTYFSLDLAEFRTLADLIAEARAMQDPGSNTVRLSRYQASLWDELDRLGVISGQAADWQRSVRALTRVGELAEPAIPQTLEAVLRPYQHTGFSWLAFLYANRLGGILADEMGLGKTLQTLALICHAKQTHDTEGPFLVVAPTSVVVNWAAECRRFAPELTVRVITETRTRRGRELTSVASGADIVITSYALFRLEYDDYAQLGWSGLILDEAQFVKNHQSRGHQCAKRLPAPFKLAITGTPMENNLMELWSLLSITAPGLFANPIRFEQQYRTPIERGNDAELLAQLRRRVKPLMLRRSKEEVARDLPDKQEQVVELELNPKHRRVYQTHLQRERQKVLGLLGDLEKNRFAIFRSLTLLRQASLDAALIDPAYANIPSTKLDVLMELLTEIVSEGHRTLVFSQFTRFLEAARRRLDADGVEYVYLDGSTRNRTAVLAEFKNGTAPVFLISLKAGGFGLNLTEADYCILLDPWWNPATEAQAVDRVHRIGQTKKVMVYRLVAKDTIEEKVVALKAAKAALFGSVMNGGQFSSGALTAADIRGMLE
ncbi:MAG: DEAD/DEAH box helicase [Geodermatophilaceae bacterium]|nr:DEAD/DEAH box helicase [Geodermatophilaceae bacterium]